MNIITENELLLLFFGLWLAMVLLTWLGWKLSRDIRKTWAQLDILHDLVLDILPSIDEDTSQEVSVG